MIYEMIPVKPITKKQLNKLRKGGESWDDFLRRTILKDRQTKVINYVK